MTATRDSDFDLVDKLSNVNTIKYSEVKSIGNGLPLGAKIAVGTLAVVGAAVVIIGIAFTTDSP